MSVAFMKIENARKLLFCKKLFLCYCLTTLLGLANLNAQTYFISSDSIVFKITIKPIGDSLSQLLFTIFNNKSHPIYYGVPENQNFNEIVTSVLGSFVDFSLGSKGIDNYDKSYDNDYLSLIRIVNGDSLIAKNNFFGDSLLTSTISKKNNSKYIWTYRFQYIQLSDKFLYARMKHNEYFLKSQAIIFKNVSP